MQSDPAPVVEPKYFLKSRTILSALLAAMPMVLGFFGITFTDADAQRIFEGASTLLALAGVILFRARATQPITFGTGTGPAAMLALLAMALAGCVNGRLVFPPVNTRISYVGSDGKTISVSSDGKSINLDGGFSAGTAAGDGKAIIEIGPGAGR